MAISRSVRVAICQTIVSSQASRNDLRQPVHTTRGRNPARANMVKKWHTTQMQQICCFRSNMRLMNKQFWRATPTLAFTARLLSPLNRTVYTHSPKHTLRDHRKEFLTHDAKRRTKCPNVTTTKKWRRGQRVVTQNCSELSACIYLIDRYGFLTCPYVRGQRRDQRSGGNRIFFF